MREIAYMPDDRPKKPWWLVFVHDHGQPCPWYIWIFTTKQFRHVLLLQEAGEGSILVDSILCRVHCVYQDVSITEAVAHAHHLGFRVMKVEERGRWGRIWSNYSCVAVIKSVLGIKNWMVLTPKQLYKHVTKAHTSTHET